MKVVLDDLELQEHIEKALIASIGDEARNRMINDAITYLITPDRDSWGNGKSPLQKAFQDAIKTAAAKYIQKEMEDTSSELYKLLVDVIQKSISKMREASSYDTISEKFALALAEAFKPKY